MVAAAAAHMLSPPPPHPQPLPAAPAADGAAIALTAALDQLPSSNDLIDMMGGGTSRVEQARALGRIKAAVRAMLGAGPGLVSPADAARMVVTVGRMRWDDLCEFAARDLDSAVGVCTCGAACRGSAVPEGRTDAGGRAWGGCWWSMMCREACTGCFTLNSGLSGASEWLRE